MKGRNLTILIAAAIFFGFAAYLSTRESRKAMPEATGHILFADLPLNDTERIVLYSTATNITVAKAGDTWVVPSVYSYPANFEKIRNALRKLTEIKVKEVMHLDPKQISQIGLVSPLDAPAGSTNNAGTLLKLMGKKDEVLASLVLGKPHERKAPAGPMAMYGGYPDGRYLATAKGDFYLVGDPMDDFSTDARSWLATDLFNVPAQDIAEVTVTGTNGPPIRLVREAGATDLKLADLDPGMETDSSKVASLSGALSFLTLSNVADPALTPKQMGLDAPTVYKARTTAGRVYTALIGGSPANDTRRYARFTVAYEPPADTNAVSSAGTVEPARGTNQVDAAKAKAEEKTRTQRETVALNEKLQKWSYLLDSYKTDSMTVSRSALVKKRETKSESSTNAVDAAAANVPASGAVPDTGSAK